MKDPADKTNANEADAFVGRKAKDESRFPKSGYYRPTKATIEWALNNNKQFAKGGITYSDIYITGDAPGKNIFAGGAKPELIQTFSRTPVLSKITPISKFANGGVSQSTPVDSNTMNTVSTVGGSGGFFTKFAMNRAKAKLDDLQMRSNIAQAIEQLGGEVPGNYMSASEKSLAKALSRAVTNYTKEQKQKKKPSKTASTNKLSADAKATGIKEIDTTQKTMPVFVTNEFANDKVLINKLDEINFSITDNFSTLMMGLGTGFQLAAPMGVGVGFFGGLLGTGMANMISSKVASALKMGATAMGEMFGMSTGGSVTRAATGGFIPKFASGGKHSIITGDAPGKNIFAGGAKPELVKSSGDMDIIPLNKTGKENQTKISRMNASERKNALATAISSHVVKFNYSLPDGVNEVSNEGEAIKVYSVKPGINDIINVNGEEITLMQLLSGVYTHLGAILATSTANSQILTAIASKPTATVSTAAPAAENPNPFAGGFPNSLDSILGGN